MKTKQKSGLADVPKVRQIQKAPDVFKLETTGFEINLTVSQSQNLNFFKTKVREKSPYNALKFQNQFLY